jgi:hypothetical protein
MSPARSLGLFTLTVVLLVSIAPLRAQDRGQAILDKATELQDGSAVPGRRDTSHRVREPPRLPGGR